MELVTNKGIQTTGHTEMNETIKCNKKEIDKEWTQVTVNLVSYLRCAASRLILWAATE
jgi:hypothetical protein